MNVIGSRPGTTPDRTINKRYGVRVPVALHKNSRNAKILYAFICLSLRQTNITCTKCEGKERLQKSTWRRVSLIMIAPSMKIFT
jgi:hypothetical protein